MIKCESTLYQYMFK